MMGRKIIPRSAARNAGRRAGAASPGELSTRENILRVAIPEFASKGFDAVPIRLIAGLAGISLPTLYFHFGDKRNLYYECCRQVFADAAIAPGQALRGAGSPAARIRNFVTSNLNVMATHRHMMRLFSRELLSPESDILPHIMDDMAMETIELLRTTLEEAIGRPVALIEPIMLYGMATGIMQYTNFGGIVRETVEDLLHRQDTLAEMILDRLFPEVGRQLRAERGE